MELFEQIIGRLNAYIKRWAILIFSPGFILIVLFVLVISWWIKPELVKHLGYLIDSGLGYLFSSGLGYFIGGVLFIWQISVFNRRSAAAEETAKAMQKQRS